MAQPESRLSHTGESASAGRNKDCIYLCNSSQHNKSAVCYYKQTFPTPFGRQPDDLVYVSEGQDHIWETDQTFTFPNTGATLRVVIPPGSGNARPGQWIDGAWAFNGANFSVFREADETLVVDNDGVELKAVYFLN